MTHEKAKLIVDRMADRNVRYVVKQRIKTRQRLLFGRNIVLLAV